MKLFNNLADVYIRRERNVLTSQFEKKNQKKMQHWKLDLNKVFALSQNYLNIYKKEIVIKFATIQIHTLVYCVSKNEMQIAELIVQLW